MSDTLRTTANNYTRQLKQLDAQMANLKKKRDDVAAALDAIKPALDKFPPPVAPAKGAAKASSEKAKQPAA